MMSKSGRRLQILAGLSSAWRSRNRADPAHSGRSDSEHPEASEGTLDGLHSLSLHPGPLPWGEGESSAVLGAIPETELAKPVRKTRASRWLFPLPEGEGQGEGCKGAAMGIFRRPGCQDPFSSAA